MRVLDFQFPSVTGRVSDSKVDLLAFPELLFWLEERYDRGKTIEDFELYDQRDLKVGAVTPRAP